MASMSALPALLPPGLSAPPLSPRPIGSRATFANWQELLADRSIDVVSICVPNAMHAEIAVAAARAGKHIICEKPLTGAFGDSGGLVGVERARSERERARASVGEVARAVRESGVLFLYAENWVYAPAMLKTKRLLETSKGAIIDIRAEESHSGSHALRSRRRETAGGGSLLMLGSHPIGAAIHLKEYEAQLAGIDPIRVTSVTATTAALYDTDAVKRGQPQLARLGLAGRRDLGQSRHGLQRRFAGGDCRVIRHAGRGAQHIRGLYDQLRLSRKHDAE